MKKTLIYGAIGGVALYIYLQLQKKKKAVTTETKPSSNNKTTMPTKGVVVKEEPKTPPAPQVEPEVIKPKPRVFIKPPLPTYEKPIDRSFNPYGFNPYGTKAYMDRFLVTPQRQIISR